MEYQPVIIIGAARSGTKLVRDIIASHPEVDKIPYDINYIWRLGNEALDHDEIAPERITPQISTKIRRYFSSCSHGAPYLVEKTVSNCLRIFAVDKVFPEARFIHLYRDGWDVIESSFRQWTAPPDWRYIIAKTRTYPFMLAFGYAMNYVSKLARHIFARDGGSVNPWGPCYQGIYQDINSKPLLEVCAIQWYRCVAKSVRDLKDVSPDRVYHLKYEDFIRDPQAKLIEIADYLGYDPKPYFNRVTDSVTSNNIGKGCRVLSDEQKQLVKQYVTDATRLLESIQR